MPNAQNIRWVSVWAMLALLTGCASTPRVMPFGPGIVPPRTIALMPLDNQTNSVPGALYVRQVLHDNLGRRGYAALPPAQVDQTLSDQLGLSLGGQIDETMIQRIGETLGVDAVLTGTLQKFGTVLALYSEVEASVAMYETRTGRKLWEHHAYARQDTALAQNHHNSLTLTAGLVGSVIQRGRGKPLQAVVRKTAHQLLNEMPNGAEPLQKGGYTD